MYVARIPNRGSPPAILLRESYRQGGKVKNRTLANLSHWPEPKVDALAQTLKGLPPKLDLSQAFEITRSLPHGHVAAALGTARRLGVEELIDATPSRARDLVTAMLVAQVIDPGSKLAVARGLRAETATSSLGRLLGVASCDEDDLYAAMDWVLERKEVIENALAARHLVNGTLVLYDVSSAAFEGRTCPLGAIGHPRDGVKGRLQIVYGLLCSPAGIPIAIEVFEGNTADPNTLAAQITKIKTRFGLSRCVWSGIGACSPTPASATRCAPGSWTGSAHRACVTPPTRWLCASWMYRTTEPSLFLRCVVRKYMPTSRAKTTTVIKRDTASRVPTQIRVSRPSATRLPAQTPIRRPAYAH